SGILRYIQAGVAQAGDDIMGHDEAVLADEAEKILAGAAAKARASLAEQVEQADLIVGRPALQEFAEAAVLLRDVGDELRIAANRHDLLRIAHDARIPRQAGPEFVGLEQQSLRLEAQERRLKTRPFALDD